MSSRNDKPARLANVLFIPSGAIGDALMMVVLADEMHRLDPAQQVTVIARRNSRLIHDLAASYPFIRVVPIERGISGMLTLLYEAMRRPYTALMPAVFGNIRALSLKQLFRALRLRPGSYSSGLLRDGEPAPYNVALPYDAKLLHFDNMRRMAAAAGLPVRTIGSPLPLLKVQEAAASMPDDSPYIVIHTFGSSSWKSWPPRRARELTQQLLERYPEYRIVLTGGPENAQEAERIAAGLPRISVRIGKPILEIAALLKSARLYIGVDTGITHLACLLQVPSVVLEHNASPEWSPTYNPNATVLTEVTHCLCKGRKNQECRAEETGKPYHRCLYEIPDSAIVAAAAQMLETSSATMDDA